MMNAMALLATLLPAAAPRADAYFKITVVDEQTGRGVPLVELKTVNNVRYYTDSAGVAAFHEPGLMNQSVFFHVKSHGYEFAKDGFGYRGKALTVTEGGSATLKIKRINLAERLYRITGGGIYRDSVLVGDAVPLSHPVLNGRVFGSDSVVNTLYRGKLYWFWGDTNRPGYPLGNFHVPGATSLLPIDGGLDPEAGVELRYFLDEDGFAKPTAKMPGQGPTWINGLVTLEDEAGREQLYAAYVKVRGFLEVYERGLARFNDATEQFDQVAEFDMQSPVFPGGHPFRHVDEGVEYVYFANPYPLVRVPSDPDLLGRLDRYESFTCLQAGSRLDDAKLDRDEDGTLRYAWKRDTPAVGPKEQAEWIEDGKLSQAESLLQLQDVQTGKPVLAHGGSVYWNRYRGRWVMIAVERYGTSALGEIWYAEADTPLGPWVYARKVITHDQYSFYNPKQHPLFDQDEGRVIFLEGTYTHTFSGNPDATPRYDYNQIMYRLDLADPRLALPVAFYPQTKQRRPDGFATWRGAAAPSERRNVAFFALDHAGEGTVPVFVVPSDGPAPALRVAAPPSTGEATRPAFHALPVDTMHPPPPAVPLYEFVSDDGRNRFYAVEGSTPPAGYQRSAEPICLVWRDPARGAFPSH